MKVKHCYFILKVNNKTIYQSQRRDDSKEGFRLVLKLCNIQPYTNEWAEALADYRRARLGLFDFSLKTEDKTFTLSFSINKPDVVIEDLETFKLLDSWYWRESKKSVKKEKYSYIRNNEKFSNHIFFIDYDIEQFVSVQNSCFFSSISVFYITDYNITTKQKKTKILKSWNDFDNMIKALDENNQKNNVSMYIYINELSVFFTFIQNSKYIESFYDKYKVFTNSNINGNTRQVLNFEINSLIFKSTKPFEIDTDVFENKLHDYTEKAIKWVDKQLGLIELKELIKVNSVLNSYNSVYVKSHNARNFTHFCNIENYNLCLPTKCNENITNFSIAKKCDIAGFLYLNRDYQYMPLKKIVHADIKSAYPFNALMRYYPYNWKNAEDLDGFDEQVQGVFEMYARKSGDIEILNEDGFDIQERTSFLNTLFNSLVEANDNYIIENSKAKNKFCFSNNDISNWFFKCRTILFPAHFISTIKIKNIKLKDDIKSLPFLRTGGSCDNIFYEKVTTYNTIYSAVEGEITINEVDFFLLQQNYDFEISYIKDLLVSFDAQLKHSYQLNRIRELADLKMQNNSNEIKTLLNSVSFGADIQGRSNVVQLYDIKANEWSKEQGERYEDKKHSFQHFTDGLYTVSYTKLQQYMLHRLINLKSENRLIYADTDSLIYEYHENVLDNIEHFNKCINFNYCNKWNFGKYKVSIYNGAVFLGYKQYIESYNYNSFDEVKISGVKTELFKKLLNERYQKEHPGYRDYNAFLEFSKKYLHPNTIISGNKINCFELLSYSGTKNIIPESERKEQVKYSGCIKQHHDYTIGSVKTLPDYINLLSIAKKHAGTDFEINATRTIL